MEHQNMHHQNSSDSVFFSPMIIVQDVLKRWIIILLAAMLVGTFSYIRADMRYTPSYSATTTYVVSSRGSSSTVFSSLSATTNLAELFEKLLNSSLMRKSILEELGDTSFDGKIKASIITETNLINVTVTGSDPRTVFLVSQAIIDHQESLTSLVLDSTALEVLRAPTVPTSPTNSANAMGQMKRTAAIAAAAATALLAALSFYSKTIRSEEEAVHHLSCDCLGELPHENKHKTFLSRIFRRKSGILISNPATSFRYVENIRKLRRRVERHMHDCKILMVTSLLENEGKSTVAANLALALSQKHDKVLLIDCDLRKPACHTIMDMKNNAEQQSEGSKQLSDVIAGKLTLEEAIVRDKKSDLHLLLQHKAIRNSGDLISSARMRALLADARNAYDYVILDLPPMAAVSDAESMMELADASLLVIRQNIAAAPALNKAVSTRADGSAKLLGCVLNNVWSSSLLSGHAQGYHYNYRYRYRRYGSKKSR